MYGTWQATLWDASDLVRRAMSKKKASVMEKERQNFVYGNPGRGSKGLHRAMASTRRRPITFMMRLIDFAKYAFNKSHAAAYAIVSYQTAYLKYYYPLEFMAALMTSVMDNVTKVSEYILTCRQVMNISILPPDINEGESGFSVSGNAIRYGLSAIKSVGRSVVDVIVADREARGPFRSMEDFVDRMSNKGGKPEDPGELHQVRSTGYSAGNQKAEDGGDALHAGGENTGKEKFHQRPDEPF